MTSAAHRDPVAARRAERRTRDAGKRTAYRVADWGELTDAAKRGDRVAAAEIRRRTRSAITL